MARTSGDIVVAAPAADVMAVIADFAAYPDWATGVRSSAVLTTDADGRPGTVRFALDATPIRDEYTLGYTWDGDASVSWEIVEAGEVLTSMDGTYVLEPADGGTKVTYQLRVDVSIPLLGMLKRKAEKVVIDSALKGLKQHVEAAGA
ncbi:SRPBCC family protein [Aeromicrobium sp. Leaf350]|uniref:SRPBCC family protein n=1 Tax=Aeromicrobium sp. Leaf350 TaxID=2876565 RepID=UPI001E28947E|nr:SRPBCC family protein [Aeromicrobium sp. Leaf350]